MLRFKSAAKTGATYSFMYVVNDKQPDKLTIVVASTEGMSGSDVGLLKLDFTILTDNGDSSAPMNLTTCQLMTENLKELPCDTIAPKNKILK